MILGNRDFALGKRSARALAIKPCRGNETVDAPADHIFDQRSSLSYAAGRIFKREAEELAFSCSHQPCPEAVGLPLVSGLVAVKIAVEEDFNSGIGPGAKPRRERRTRDDRGGAPMVGHDQHREAIADERCKQIDELIDLALETRRDIMDRC